MMQQIFANLTASISELKTNPSGIIEKAHGETVAVLNHNKLAAYLVSPVIYEKIIDILDDLEMTPIIKERLKDIDNAIEISIDDL